jgi:hypothetical protein
MNKDTIYRQDAIDAICDNCDAVKASCPHYPCGRYVAVEKLQSAQPPHSGRRVYMAGYAEGYEAARKENA